MIELNWKLIQTFIIFIDIYLYLFVGETGREKLIEILQAKSIVNGPL